MGIIWSKFRKEKSTQEVLEALQEKIDTLETFTVNTKEQKKRIVGNFLAVSIGVYVIAFVVFYFVYFPPTWQERIVYFVPLLLFPIIIILLRYLFTWYFQRKLNKNSKKLTALRAEKKKILEQVMDKETYKVAVNLLARFADKPSKTSFALSTSTPSKLNQTPHNRSLPSANLNQRSKQLALTSSTPVNYMMSTNTPRLISQMGPSATSSPSSSTALMSQHSGLNQQLRRRTPFPIVNQQEKGVFDRIVDVLIGDGPQDRFAMICKECYSHNGMALKDDFEYTTFRCAFCNALNPARKSRPVAPRLSVMPAPAQANAGSDTSDSEDEKDDSDDEAMNLNGNTTTAQFSTPSNINNLAANKENVNAATATTTPPSSSTSTSDVDEEKRRN
ncbi:LOW QUALITY PROTEIN: endoplasmic reticulum junction formation protein lunapark-A [Lucilia sericata]|uniref:LOW QUALITY PROTEIN: endoplasmic reticulum junction formation protein lunapark-A n=1 Tax=Lucilia sericata TaxID=13632 RepID=UPI0018A8532D|nr:LOW QUALITY PROTEIN: endoplasmic reticulum junction formation protein lunapark-A [Lucilia sericata]